MELSSWISLDGTSWQDTQPSCYQPPWDAVRPTPATPNEKLAHKELVSISIADNCAAHIRLMRKVAGISLTNNWTPRL
jgi:hypothetical protein